MKRLLLVMACLSPTAATLAQAQSAGHGHGEHAETSVDADVLQKPAYEPGTTPTHDHMAASRFTWLKIDELEAVDTEEGKALGWEGGLSWGGHFDRLWLTSEGVRDDGRSHELETRLFWSHAAARWRDVTLGLRQDSGEADSRTWAEFGIKGLAPYWFEVAATAFVGESGQSALRLEGEYELLLTNRLILQPEIELDFYGKDDAERLQGKGLSESVAGLRLRYEIRREFAPYIGIEWERLHGDTAELARAAGEETNDSRAVVGLRLWY